MIKVYISCSPTPHLCLFWILSPFLASRHESSCVIGTNTHTRTHLEPHTPVFAGGSDGVCIENTWRERETERDGERQKESTHGAFYNVNQGLNYSCADKKGKGILSVCVCVCTHAFTKVGLQDLFWLVKTTDSHSPSGMFTSAGMSESFLVNHLFQKRLISYFKSITVT